MKRDKELLREILLYLESINIGKLFIKSNDNNDDAEVGFEGFKQNDLVEHVRLLLDSCYINGSPTFIANDVLLSVFVSSITMEGYEFIDKISDQGIWTDVKKELGVVGDFWTLETISKLAVKIASKKLGIS